jgi:hypothetical protein
MFVVCWNTVGVNVTPFTKAPGSKLPFTARTANR